MNADTPMNAPMTRAMLQGARRARLHIERGNRARLMASLAPLNDPRTSN